MTSFKVITQTRMGAMRPGHKRDLKRFEMRRQALFQELEELEGKQQTVMEHIAEYLKIDTGGPFRGLQFEDNGDVHAVYCTCAVCQAELNHVTVEEATEAMIEMGFIHGHEADEMRRKAKKTDLKRGAQFPN